MYTTPYIDIPNLNPNTTEAVTIKKTSNSDTTLAVYNYDKNHNTKHKCNYQLSENHPFSKGNTEFLKFFLSQCFSIDRFPCNKETAKYRTSGLTYTLSPLCSMQISAILIVQTAVIHSCIADMCCYISVNSVSVH